LIKKLKKITTMKYTIVIASLIAITQGINVMPDKIKAKLEQKENDRLEKLEDRELERKLRKEERELKE